MTVTATDGRRVRELLGPRVRSLTLPLIGFTDALRVTVAAVGPRGARGASAGASGQGSTAR